MLSAPFHGTCKRVMEATSSLRMGVLYRIEPMWEWSNLQQSDMALVSLKKLGYGMIKQFERELGLGARDCTRCEAWVDAAEYSVGFQNLSMPEYFIVHIEYMTNKFCGENTIASALLNIRGTKMQVENSHGLTITISAELETRPIEQVLNSTIAIFDAIVPMACFDVFYIDLTQTKLRITWK